MSHGFSHLASLLGLCHDLAGGVRMVVDNLGLVLCVVHSSYVTALTESKVAWQVTQLL